MNGCPCSANDTTPQPPDGVEEPGHRPHPSIRENRAVKLGGRSRIVADYRRTFAIVRTLPCDLLLTPHPDNSGWRPAATAAPLPHPVSCRAYADDAERNLDAALRKQREAKR